MEKRRYIRRMLRMAALAVGMVLVGGASAWGQQTYTITPQDGKTFPQTDVPTLVDTVYVDNNETRLLEIGNYVYYWYFRWYRLDENGNGTINKLRRENTSRDYLQEAGGEDPSYFWLHSLSDLKDDGWSGRQGDHRYVAQINYTGDGTEDVVYCDVSFNVDGLGLNPRGSEYTEPTIGKRYKFIIKPASEIKDRLDDFIENRESANAPMRTIRITVPEGATGVNLQMDLDPKSYFWGSSQGNTFQYSIVDAGDNYQDLSSDSKLIRLGYEEQGAWNDDPIWHDYTINQETTVNVYAESSGGSESPCLVRFILTPQENSDFATIISDERNPAGDSRKYAQIGVVDFDYNEAIPRNRLDNNNNMRSEPVDPSSTTYSFADPDLPWISEQDLMPEDAYGLYRSAMVRNVSERHSHGDNWPPSYHPDEDFREYEKSYGWYYNNINTYRNTELYDRTYYNTKQDSCGYFYYVNASAEAGRVVTIPIEGTICPNTELIITAWVADISDNTTRPNVSLVLRGERTNEETGETESVVLHRFSSGAMKGSDRATWKQLCYRITVTSEIASYSNFVVDFENNTPNSDGGDYAIDDIRIYRTLPNIEVYRENACDAATLIVSTDYETILQNMGWTDGLEVITEEEYNEITENTTDEELREILDKRKYRYGLMGDNPENPQHLNSVVGNVYFAFLSFDDKNHNDKIDSDEKSTVKWQSVNKAIVEENPDLNLEKVAMSIRIAVPTVLKQSETQGEQGFEFYTQSRLDAIKNGQIMNYRAIQDYNHDIAYWQTIEPSKNHTTIDVSNLNPEEGSFDEMKYNQAIRTLYARLGIPRIRCPWYGYKHSENEGDQRDTQLYLGIIDVDNTDLKYQNEPLPDGTLASGEYWVVTFSAEQVVVGGEGSVTDFDECTLMSPFTVQPATTIAVETMTDATTALCEGAIRKITPTLSIFDPETNEPVTDGSVKYIFDWYLGSEEEYKALLFGTEQDNLNMVIEAYRNRDGGTDHDEIDPDAFVNWMNNNYGDDAAGTIRGLFNDGKLLTGTEGGETLIIEIRSEDYIAMPYVWDESSNKEYVYCTDWTKVHFDITDNDIPDFYVGLRLADNPVALRLGRRHLASDAAELTIPISKALKMADGVDHFGLAEVQPGDENPNPVYVVINGVYTPVGQLTELNVPRPASDGSVTNATLEIKWNEQALNLMHEGVQYILRIPFVQIGKDEDGTETVLASQCDGLAYFPVKVVPEYLTWKGDTSDNWYDENKWNQSTEEELYMGDKTRGEDANGSDNITDAFSPLYFTKITIPGEEGNSELALKDENTIKDDGDSRFLAGWATDDSDSIRYEMAVDTVAGGVEVKPYYINKVDQIYFKPNATLLNQQHLTYKKAWVDFEMTPGDDYWMASPLKEVYAGDMYAPKANGRQETEAFEDIIYKGENEASGSDIINDRWNPAFYQKAWDKAITYAANATNGVPSDTDLVTQADDSPNYVKSNWSIEYNDVTVPYSLGKGFYSRVEKDSQGNALVRLPKKDDEYKYELSTKALTETGKVSADYGKMADGTDITIDLSVVDSETTAEKVDGDGKHFLVGNPYMSYLNMDAFFDANTNLVRSYWTISGGTQQVAVGTPDVGWTGNETETGDNISGILKPMTAFFIELKSDATEKTIKFTPEMMTAKPVTTVGTRAYTAENPKLMLTATSKQGKSRAAVIQKSDASNQYESDKDAVTLLDSELDAPTVYTVAGNYAAAVNAIHDYKNVPLGVYADADEEVELTIEGASQLVEPLYLYDAVTRSTTPIDGDSYTLNLQGSSHGRYFLTTDEGITVESDIRIYSPADGQLIIASTPSDKLKHVQVYDLSGRVVDSRQNIGMTTCQISVPGGIYIIRAESEHGEAQAKLKVR